MWFCENPPLHTECRNSQMTYRAPKENLKTKVRHEVAMHDKKILKEELPPMMCSFEDISQ